MIRRLKIVISFVLLLFGISTAMAASIQCGTQIISDDQRNGQTKSEVLELCGEPTSKKMNTGTINSQMALLFGCISMVAENWNPFRRKLISL